MQKNCARVIFCLLCVIFLEKKSMPDKDSSSNGPKNAPLLRYITIDSCLQNRYGTWTLEALQEACIERLLDAGLVPKASDRTIEYDIGVLRNGSVFGVKAPIETVPPEGNTPKHFRYTDPNFSIRNGELPPSVVTSLQQSMSFLKLFSGFSAFKDLEGLIEKLDKRIDQEHKPNDIIEFEYAPSDGVKHLDRLYNAILNEEALDINYKPFHREKAGVRTVHPYLLKEYRNRWFLVGLSHFESNAPGIYVFGLERMDSIKKSKMGYIPNKHFLPKEYFKYAIGTSMPKGAEHEEIILSFIKKRGQYVETKKLHWSQKTLINNKKELRVSLQLANSRELIRLILSYRDHVKVIAPESLRQHIKNVLKKMWANYK